MNKEIHYKPTTEESFDGFKMKFYSQDEASNLDIPRYLHDEGTQISTGPMIDIFKMVKRKTIKRLDQEFYKEVWSKRPHVCEETGVSLGDEMRPIFMSHILSKGAKPHLRHDPNNINILSPEAHQDWEFGGRRTTMRIFYKNYPYMVVNGYVPSDEEERAYQVWQEKNKKKIQ